MLGEQIGEEKGKVTGQRVLDIDESGTPKIETTFSSNAKFKGIDTVNTVTYWTVPRPGGMLYGEAKGVVMSKDVSGEVVTFTAYAVGRFTSLGRARFHGSVYYRTRSTGKLAFLNNLVGLFEHDSDEQGNTSSKIWEWK
jgi:hypothetical protein